VKRLTRISLTLFLALLVVAGVGGWLLHSRLTAPYRGFQEPEKFVEIPPGTRERDIARRLAEAGVVPDEWTFRLAARLSNADRRLQAGEYRFADPATPFIVASRMARGDVYRRGITFPEGLTIREMAGIYERQDLGTAAEFEKAASDPSLAVTIDPDARSLEGYLFPSTYVVPRNSDAPFLIRTMFAQFSRVLDARLRDAASEKQMSVRELVTLASLVEKETAKPEERAIVAAVYRNRLAQRMPLQCDPTVIYALMLAGRWNGNITKEDLQIDSPYNTYRYPGLPPGPIAAPGKGSLEAAANPADVPYVYFVSRNDGTHVFASTLDEHNRNVQEWQKSRRTQ
jgi:UPF0755 protein